MQLEQFGPKIVKFSFQAILILLISFAAGEVSLRVYNYFYPNYIFYSDDSYNRFRGKPYADHWGFKLNSMGFKDEEFTPKEADSYRIIGIGDSFSFGVVPYDHNYLTLTESQLRQQDLNVEVLNMGISGTGPEDYLALLVQEGLPLQPDMLLLSFFVGNDFAESRNDLVKRELHSYSYIASLLHYVLTIKSKYQANNGSYYGNYCDDCPNFTHSAYLEVERKRSYIYNLGNATFTKDLHETKRHLEQIQRICEDNNIELIVVIIPDELQINPELQTELIETYFPSLPPGFWHVSYPNDTLSEYLTALEVDHVDLYDAFVQAGQKQSLYRPRDTHWNIAGNQLAADIIVENLQDYISK